MCTPVKPRTCYAVLGRMSGSWLVSFKRKLHGWFLLLFPTELPHEVTLGGSQWGSWEARRRSTLEDSQEAPREEERDRPWPLDISLQWFSTQAALSNWRALSTPGLLTLTYGLRISQRMGPALGLLESSPWNVEAAGVGDPRSEPVPLCCWPSFSSHSTVCSGDAHSRGWSSLRKERKRLPKSKIFQNNGLQTSARSSGGSASPASSNSKPTERMSIFCPALPVPSERHRSQSHKSIKTLSGNTSVI